MTAAPISTVAIAGGGVVAWSAAAALRRHLRSIEVAVIASPPPADALADRIGCTLPSIVAFHEDLRLTEDDTVVRAGSGFRLGTRFEGWAAGERDYVHAYGEYGRALGAAAFHQHWLRAAESGAATPFDAFSSAAAMAAADRFVHPDKAEAKLLLDYDYALHIDPPRYGEMMRAFALHLGASEITGAVADVRLRGESGFVDALVLDGGREVSADLFIDATGPAAVVRSRLGGERHDWSRWFVADRILYSDGPATTPPALLDRALAFDAGWSWEAASPTRTSHGLVYASAHLSDEEASRRLENTAQAAAIRPGRWAEPWLRNCVAIGDSAVAVEPLEWTNLHLADNAIDRLVAMMPDRDFCPVELWDYNRQVTAEADRARDFLLLHYATAKRPHDPFWGEAAQRPLPPSLDHTLTQFRERGRLPFYEEETFSRDSWAAVLVGQGVRPRRIDPLIDATPPRESDRLMDGLRHSIRSTVEGLPLHSAYFEALARAAR